MVVRGGGGGVVRGGGGGVVRGGDGCGGERGWWLWW